MKDSRHVVFSKRLAFFMICFVQNSDRTNVHSASDSVNRRPARSIRRTVGLSAWHRRRVLTKRITQARYRACSRLQTPGLTFTRCEKTRVKWL
jgi:hypothetical protein